MNLVLLILRGVFVLMLAGIGWHYVVDENRPLGTQTWLALALALAVAALVVCVDILAPRKKLTLFAGTFLGLIVGIAMSYALSFVVQLLVEQFVPLETVDVLGNAVKNEEAIRARNSLQSFLNLIVGGATTYLAVSFILQTKDDFRFIIPYVEFRKQLRGSRPLLLDTSVLIDGRIAAVLDTGIFESQLIVPRFVLAELQAVADSPDRLKRARGRRGLDVLAKLQQSPKAEVVTYDHPSRDENEPVDQRLLTLAKELEARLVTTDYNLNKVAQLAGVDVLNINELAAKMKPEVLPGERLRVRLIKPGESPGQGIGYMEDGTMVVVEQGRAHIDSEVDFVVTNTVQTNAGKMIFGRLGDAHKADRPDRGDRSKPAPAAS
ncbi:MAG TPA: PIN domain-containing protein [Tepidisphaeraceae bacterium]|jgi:uncharacterized protein YacL